MRFAAGFNGVIVMTGETAATVVEYFPAGKPPADAFIYVVYQSHCFEGPLRDP